MAKDEPKAKPAFRPTTLKKLEFVSTLFELQLEEGYTPADLNNPGSFAHIAKSLRKGSLILATTADETWTALVRVYAAGDTWAKVHPLILSEHGDLARDADKVPAEFAFKIDRTSEGFRIIHKETGKVAAKGIATRAEADTRMKELIAQAA